MSEEKDFYYYFGKMLYKENEYLQVRNMKLIEENQQLKDNWNKLKEWLEDEYKRCDEMGNPAVGYAMGQINRTKNKMQEIEKGGVND